ncbi:unnamed protein product [Albugo candida]|nr:unnamed protein product [Albugo candida]|eukprot:CCI50888.1 unnamed protein product [Albugo candida]
MASHPDNALTFFQVFQRAFKCKEGESEDSVYRHCCLNGFIICHCAFKIPVLSGFFQLVRLLNLVRLAQRFHATTSTPPTSDRYQTKSTLSTGLHLRVEEKVHYKGTSIFAFLVRQGIDEYVHLHY